MDSHDVQHDIGYERRKAAYKREYIKKKKRKRMIHNAIVIALRLLAAAVLLVVCIKVIDALIPSVTQTSKKQETNKTAADQETKEDGEKKQTQALEAKSDIDPLILVNNKHKLSENVTPKLVEVYHGIFVDKSVAEPLKAMIDAANEAGYDVYAASGYHTKERQQVLYDAKVNEYIAGGKSKKDAEKLAKKEVSLPENSEYLTGLSVDLLSAEETQDDSQFGDTDAAGWLMEHCKEYGFILRYPEEKEEVTEMKYSAFHYRYVGKDAAAQIMKQGIALEEYKTK